MTFETASEMHVSCEIDLTHAATVDQSIDLKVFDTRTRTKEDTLRHRQKPAMRCRGPIRRDRVGKRAICFDHQGLSVVMRGARCRVDGRRLIRYSRQFRPDAVAMCGQLCHDVLNNPAGEAFFLRSTSGGLNPCKGVNTLWRGGNNGCLSNIHPCFKGNENLMWSKIIAVRNRMSLASFVKTRPSSGRRIWGETIYECSIYSNRLWSVRGRDGDGWIPEQLYRLAESAHCDWAHRVPDEWLPLIWWFNQRAPGCTWNGLSIGGC